MNDREQAVATAIDFTRRALDLVDEAGDSLAAIHLQTALDTLTEAPIARTAEEAEAMLQSPDAQKIMARWFQDKPSTSVHCGPSADDVVAELLETYGERALGHARMRLFAALHQQDQTAFHQLTHVCQLLIFRHGQSQYR